MGGGFSSFSFLDVFFAGVFFDSGGSFSFSLSDFLVMVKFDLDEDRDVLGFDFFLGLKSGSESESEET